MFKFLKRLRGKDVDASAPGQDGQLEALVEVLPGLESAPQDVAPVKPEAETQKTTLKSDAVANKREILEPALVSVELPKRSLGTGIRSLFSDSMDIDELEDI